MGAPILALSLHMCAFKLLLGTLADVSNQIKLLLGALAAFVCIEIGG